jgi:hypothetical protein
MSKQSVVAVFAWASMLGACSATPRSDLADDASATLDAGVPWEGGGSSPGCVGAGGQCVTVAPASGCPAVTQCPKGMVGVELSCGDADARQQCCAPAAADAAIPCDQAGGTCTPAFGSSTPCRLNCMNEGDNYCPPSSSGAMACCFATDACIPKPARVCVLMQLQCGVIADGCGGTISCGTCGGGQVCSDAGTCGP